MNAGPAGTETMKNLILPGVCRCLSHRAVSLLLHLSYFVAAIGSFTIVDGGQVTPADLGNNFFVEAQHVGKPRAEVLLCVPNTRTSFP